MLVSDKVKIIQDLQCKHASWLADYSNALSLGQCPESWIMNNIMISNMIKVLYRYTPFTQAITNADSITITLSPENITDVYNISISYGAVNLVTFSGSGSQQQIVDSIVTLINENTITHEYYCVSKDNVLYLYTYSGSYTYSSTPTVVISETNLSVLELTTSTYQYTELNSDELLDLWNCISVDDFCDIVCKIKSLITNCNC